MPPRSDLETFLGEMFSDYAWRTKPTSLIYLLGVVVEDCWAEGD